MKTIKQTFITTALSLLLVGSAWANTNPEAEKEALIADWERAKEFTLEYIDAMTEEGFFKSPVEGIRNFAQQMLHLADGNAGIVALGTGVPGPFQGRSEQDKSLDTKAKVREAVVKSYDYVIEALKGMDMSTADEGAEGFGMTFPRIEWIKKAFEHQTHHRGQATIYLRMQGITPPAEKLF